MGRPLFEAYLLEDSYHSVQNVPPYVGSQKIVIKESGMSVKTVA